MTMKNFLRKDFYFFLLNTHWTKLLGILFLLYVLGNSFFAWLFSRIPNSIEGRTPSFEEAFHFSVQTMSTIGYGSLSPSGTAANLIVFIESFIGLISVAIVTGIVFARISRPQAKIRFSKNVLRTKFDGVDSLCFRIGNTRGNDIVEAKVHLSALINEVTEEGEKIRRIHNLSLVRNYSPFFRLSWFVIHRIDKNSPFHDHLRLDEKFEGLMATVTGHDGTYSTTVYDQKFYEKSDLISNRYFADIMPEGRSDSIGVNYEKFDELKP
jgi:inward rectifier potassium channel